jgi:hypothetical protein
MTKFGESWLTPVLLGASLFLPVFLYLQWSLPRDGPYEVVPVAIAGSAAVAAAWALQSAGPVVKVFARTTLVLASLVGAQVLFPQVSRRVGPWASLRRILMEQSSEVARAAAGVGVPPGKPIPREVIAEIEARLVVPRPRFSFPLVQRDVRVRIMMTIPPYVGVDYGEGRNCVFDLGSMKCTYAD